MKHAKTKPRGLMEGACELRLEAVGDALYAIGGKWKLRIIIVLGEGPQRFNELQRKVKGISARVLSNELKELEANGFIKREVLEGPPTVVEYKRLDYSKTLHDVLSAMVQWGAQHKEKIKAEIKSSAKRK